MRDLYEYKKDPCLVYERGKGLARHLCIMPNKAGGNNPRNDDFGSSKNHLQLLPFEGMYVIVKLVYAKSSCTSRHNIGNRKVLA